MKTPNSSRTRAKSQATVAGRGWGLRLGALVLVPVLFLAGLEAILRVAELGYRTHFLVPFSFDGRKLLAQNNQFGWRFFGPQMARNPYAIALAPGKPNNTVRIFVFGESAAYGDPEPRFGLPRMLQALLSMRYPEGRFEVVNAAMTGINSYVILPIAQDCAGADGDIWVLYMGNNEVVGPFGAGTIFGPRTLPLPLVRSRLALLTTRTGQALDLLVRRFQAPALSESEWGGMQMFLDHPVRADDQALAPVYRHFARNLAEIVELAKEREVGLVLSTVAVNLRDCGPFASAHRRTLTALDKEAWEELYVRGTQSLAVGDVPLASSCFDKAAAIDDQMAELRFRQAECAMKLGLHSDAQRHFEAARDLDTLRFRCDSRLNDLIRQTAARHASSQLRLVDAARTFAESSKNGVPGDALFCDHVHFTFEGTYLLARAVAEQIQSLLPETIRSHESTNAAWPTPDDCAQRLGWNDWARRNFLTDVWKRQTEPPFTAQANHSARTEALRKQLWDLRTASSRAAVRSARLACEAALNSAPDNPELLLELAALREEDGDLAGAEFSVRAALSLLPTSGEIWSQLGRILAIQERYATAEICFRTALKLDGQDVSSMLNLAQSLVKLGKVGDATATYEQAVKLKPRFGLAWLGLAQLLEQAGRKSEADAAYQRALANPIRSAGELLTTARFCQQRGWSNAALTNYSKAIELNPTDPKPYLELGRVLAASGRHAEAAMRYAQLVQLAPELAEAHFLYGVEAGRLGRPQDAAEAFRRAAELKPELVEAHLNLGMALMKQGKSQEALEEFESVLARDSANAVARRNAELLRKEVKAER